jgi:Na+-translocating ferredoxin:NAD+ oxidoreductase RnfC subunit
VAVGFPPMSNSQYCPRFLLGYAVEPHQVVRSLAFTATGKEHWNQWAALCCACGLCTLYGCPEKSLGAIIHAPFDATVAEVTEKQIILTR